MSSRPNAGVYALLIQVPKQETIRIGRLGPVSFGQGVHVYIGSALNSLEGRVSRHFRTEKQKHWHVDFLLGGTGVKLLEVASRRTRREIECTMSRAVQKRALSSTRRFGCSDCKCDSHLHYVRTLQRAYKVLAEAGFVRPSAH
jgi:Uri superfamily endonuclease